MTIYYISISPDDIILTLDVDVKALYGPTEHLAKTSKIVSDIKSELTPTGIVGMESFTGADILSNAWATYIWLKNNNHEPVWISNPPDIPEVDGIP